MRKFINLLIIASTSCAVTGCFGTKTSTKDLCEPWLKPDSSVYRHLGERLSSILFSPDSVKCYHLAYRDTVDKKKDINDNFIRDRFLCRLSKEQTVVLQYVLMNNYRSYSHDSIRVQAPYLPSVEFLFIKQDSLKASVIISTSDMTWTVVSGNKTLFNYDYVDIKVVNRYCNELINKYYCKKIIKR